MWGETIWFGDGGAAGGPGEQPRLRLRQHPHGQQGPTGIVRHTTRITVFHAFPIFTNFFLLYPGIPATLHFLSNSVYKFSHSIKRKFLEKVPSVKSGLGVRSSVFQAIHTFFVSERVIRKLLPSLFCHEQPERIAPITLLSWATWANRSRSLFCKERLAQIA